MRLMRQSRDWLRAAENAKTGYRWLILTFFATWWFWSFPVQAEKDRSYGRTALIEVAPPSDFLPTTALLDNGALECPSQMPLPSFNQILFGCMRSSARVKRGSNECAAKQH
jgi:hypothetical protein